MIPVKLFLVLFSFFPIITFAAEPKSDDPVTLKIYMKPSTPPNCSKDLASAIQNEITKAAVGDRIKFVTKPSSANHTIISECKEKPQNSTSNKKNVGWQNVNVSLKSLDDIETPYSASENTSTRPPIDDVASQIFTELNSKIAAMYLKSRLPFNFVTIPAKNLGMLDNEAVLGLCATYQGDSQCHSPLSWRIPYTDELMLIAPTSVLQQQNHVADKKFSEDSHVFVIRNGQTPSVNPKTIIHNETYSQTLYCVCRAISVENKCRDELYKLYRDTSAEDTTKQASLEKVKTLLFYLEESYRKTWNKTKPSKETVIKILQDTDFRSKLKSCNDHLGIAPQIFSKSKNEFEKTN